MYTIYFILGVVILFAIIYFAFFTPKKIKERKQIYHLQKKYSGVKLLLNREQDTLLDEDGNPIEDKELGKALVWLDMYYRDSIITPILPVRIQSIRLFGKNCNLITVIRSDPFQFEVMYVGDRKITVKSPVLGEISFSKKKDFQHQVGETIVMKFVDSYDEIRTIDVIKLQIIK